jgi:phospholipid/cholesterol/gamma-HCH transport system ATP-binding protein
MSSSPKSPSLSGAELTDLEAESPLEEAPADKPLIVYRGVSKSFDDRVVLRDIELEIYPGETVAILGRSGSGKTVMTSMLVGLEAPDQGTITVAGVELSELQNDEDWRDLRLRTGYLFQGVALYDSMNIGDNVAFPMKQHTNLSQKEIYDRVRDKLSQVGLEESMHKRPDELSGGMARRAALARSLALDPRLIIYDEPTAGLDPITVDDIGRLIRRLQKDLGVTSVVVTHDLRLTERIADRVAMLEEGTLAFLGTFEEFQQSDNPEARLFLHPGEAAEK